MAASKVALEYQPLQSRIRKSFLRAEYGKVDVPVIEVTYREWKKRFLQLDGDDYDHPSQFMGVYHNNRDAVRLGLPRRFILINASMPNYEKLMVYYHELGHHSCVLTGCLCAKNGFVFRKTELHAELAAIYLATKRGFADMTLQFLQEAVRDLENPSFHYIWNATRMVKHPAFSEAVEFVGDPFHYWMAKKRHLKERYENALVDAATRMCRWTPSRFLRRFADGN
jgi:hypothetical protein